MKLFAVPMTRYTSLGRKRTYLQAGFDNGAKDGQSDITQNIESEQDVLSKKMKVHSSGDGGDDTTVSHSHQDRERHSNKNGAKLAGWKLDRSKLRGEC